MECYESSDFEKVYLGDGEALKIVGKWHVRISTSNGSMLQLHWVRHIPCLRKNLLSIKQLDAKGYVVAFGCNNWNINKGSIVVAWGKKKGKLYTMTNTKNCSVVA